MRFIKYFIIIIAIAFSCKDVIAQPYIYSKGAVTDSSWPNQTQWIYSINRFNLSNNKDELFVYNGGNIEFLTWDPSQNLIIADYYSDHSVVYNCNDTLNNFELMENITGLKNTFLYSKAKNIIYIYGHEKAGESNSSLSLNAIDLNTHKRISSVPLSFDAESSGEDMFFSNDESKIYLSGTDAVTQKSNVITYSTALNKVILSEDISAYGYPGLDVYLLYKGSKGKCIIESYKRADTSSYFRIYDLDNNKGSGFIWHKGDADAFYIDNGKKILTAEKRANVNENYYTGKLFFYDVNSTKLIRTSFLSPGGEIYIFDNYPDMFYYYLPEEKKAASIDITKITQPATE